MREATRRPGGEGDAAGRASAEADSDAADGGGAAAGEAQASARLERAHKRRAAAHDAEADAFNQRHAAEVAEFNQLTRDACLREDGKLDAEAVKQWQREHHVAPDGKVGPKTLAAAGGTAKDTDGDAAKIDGPQGKEDQASTAKVGAQGRSDGAAKKNGPAEDVLEWLGVADIRQAVAHLQALKLAPAGDKKDKGDQKNKGDQKEQGHKQPAPEEAGLNSKLSVDAFGNAFEKLRSRWSDITPSARAAELVALANEQLVNAVVFPVDALLDPSVNGRVAGKFSNEHWKIRLNKELFSKARFAADDAPQLAATVYHEARHAEQYFRMAQMLAGQSDPATAEKIGQQLRVPAEVAAAAIRMKILPGDPAAKFAQNIFDDRLGNGAEHNHETLEQVEAQMEVYRPLFERLEAAKASGDEKAIEEAHAALAKIKQSVMHAWNEYIKLASEADAFKAEHAVEAKLGVAPQ